MARKGVSQRVQTPDPGLKDALELLAQDHDVISSPAVTLINTGNIPPGASVVVFNGGGSKTLTLPPARALGPGIAAIIFLLNTSTNAVTLVPSLGDSVNGTTLLIVGSNVLVVLGSDGVNKWLRNL